MPGDKTIWLSSAYLAPVEYYQLLNSGSRIVIEQYDHYIKQTYRNRCRIASANGIQTLSIPIVKPSTGKAYTRDIRIADHDHWQHLHWTAIVSAYNSTPFFELLEEDFRRFYTNKYDFLFDFNEELRRTICQILEIEPELSFSPEYLDSPGEHETDYRESIHPKKASLQAHFRPYYQVFENRYGFQENLSIIDLLFNMGPETALIIR